MKRLISLVKGLLLVASLCELHNTTCEVYATISNRSSSYNNSFSRERSHVEWAKQAAGIYHARNHPNKVHQHQPTESNCHIKTISAEEYARIAPRTDWLQQELAQQKEIRDTFNKQVPQLDAITSDTQELYALYQEYDPETHIYLEKRLIVSKDIQTNTVSYSTQSYKLNTDVIDTLHAYGINKENYTSVYGNKLQQTIHQECIAILEKAAQLPTNSPIYEYKPTLIDCVESARVFNQQGSVSKAIRITNFCWSLLDYGKAIIEGIAAGIVGATQDIIEHPVQTMLSLVIGEYILAYNVGKALVEVGQIGVLALVDKDQAKQRLDDYLEPTVQVIKAIEKEEISLRDAIRGTAQFAAGFYAQSKLLGGLGKFYKGIEAKARAFINKNSFLSPEHYFATPEGILFKSVTNHETRNSSKTIPVKVTQREVVLPKVKTYEQARNKALEIIGEVDSNLSKPRVGNLGVGKGKIVGRAWHNDKVILRIDYDPIKGAHINITDYRAGKGNRGISIAIPFEGDEAKVNSLLKPLNTHANLLTAKAIFEKIENDKDLAVIMQALKLYE